jgi:hypothetical protein
MSKGILTQIGTRTFLIMRVKKEQARVDQLFHHKEVFIDLGLKTLESLAFTKMLLFTGWGAQSWTKTYFFTI